MKLDPKKKVAAEFSSGDASVRKIIEANRDAVVRLGLLTEFRVGQNKLSADGGARSTAQFDLRIPHVEETVDAAAEITRIQKEIDGLQKAIASKEKQLGNETFRSRAPENIIKQMEETLGGQRVELQKLQTRLAQLRA
jgi:valyl-tRNA synthetase